MKKRREEKKEGRKKSGGGRGGGEEDFSFVFECVCVSFSSLCFSLFFLLLDRPSTRPPQISLLFYLSLSQVRSLSLSGAVGGERKTSRNLGPPTFPASPSLQSPTLVALKLSQGPLRSSSNESRRVQVGRARSGVDIVWGRDAEKRRVDRAGRVAPMESRIE